MGTGFSKGPSMRRVYIYIYTHTHKYIYIYTYIYFKESSLLIFIIKLILSMPPVIADYSFFGLRMWNEIIICGVFPVE